MAARILLTPTVQREGTPVVEPNPTVGGADPIEAVWERALRDYALVLDQHRELLARVEHTDAGEITVPHFEPPAGIPPLPESLLSWAEVLSRETEELVQQATEFLARTRPAATPVRSTSYLTDAASSFDRKV